MFKKKLLLKPLKFKIVSSGDWTQLVEGNFKMLATILFYIVRQVSDNTDVPLVNFIFIKLPIFIRLS